MNLERNLNDIKIYFGIVMDIKDDLHLNRIKCSIKDYTDNIPKDDLPWYYPFFGQNYLPTVGDTVPIFILSDNFSMGFYNPKIDLTDRLSEKSIGDGDEYEQYVEMYDKLGIQATYKKEKGWEFKNKESFIQINTEKISLKTPSEQIIITDDRIDVGNDGPAMPLGDKTVEAFEKHLQLMVDKYNEIMGIFVLIAAASNSPFTLPIKIALDTKLPTSIPKFIPNVTSIKTHHKTIQSKKVFIE